jgi:hypothetical protein
MKGNYYPVKRRAFLDHNANLIHVHSSLFVCLYISIRLVNYVDYVESNGQITINYDNNYNCNYRTFPVMTPTEMHVTTETD